MNPLPALAAALLTAPPCAAQAAPIPLRGHGFDRVHSDKHVPLSLSKSPAPRGVPLSKLT
ncbi:MAG: hypothetical protein IJL48_02450 [Bacteroidales bacterium]|nr:hypothetical protein [Bacteroidales bacterium]